MATLSWQPVDLVKETIWFATQKTGKRLSMRLAQPLLDYPGAQPNADDTAEPISQLPDVTQ